MAKFKVNQSVYIKHQGATPWRIVQIDNPERGDDALYHLRDSRNTYERELGRNLIGTDEPNASARAYNLAATNTKNSDGLSVGDKVKYRYMPGVDVDEVFEVKKDIDFQNVLIKRLRDGKEWKEFSYNLVPVRNSSCKNPVVRNALAWRAKNALVSRYNPGDIVLYERRSPAVHTTVDGFMPGFREKMKIQLVAKRSGGLWDAKDDGGNKIVVHEADFIGKA